MNVIRREGRDLKFIMMVRGGEEEAGRRSNHILH